MTVSYLWHNNLFQFVDSLLKTDINERIQQMGIQRSQHCSNPVQKAETPKRGKISETQFCHLQNGDETSMILFFPTCMTLK